MFECCGSIFKCGIGWEGLKPCGYPGYCGSGACVVAVAAASAVAFAWVCCRSRVCLCCSSVFRATAAANVAVWTCCSWHFLSGAASISLYLRCYSFSVVVASALAIAASDSRVSLFAFSRRSRSSSYTRFISAAFEQFCLIVSSLVFSAVSFSSFISRVD